MMATACSINHIVGMNSKIQWFENIYTADITLNLQSTQPLRDD